MSLFVNSLILHVENPKYPTKKKKGHQKTIKTNIECKMVQSEIEVTQLCPTLCDPMDSIAYQALLCMGFSRQECWSGLLFPSPGSLPILQEKQYSGFLKQNESDHMTQQFHF